MTTQPPESKSLAKFSDGISDLSYLPKNDVSLLASTSWDGSVRLHDTQATNTAVLAHQMESGPLLGLAIPQNMDAIATGGLDGSVRLLDISTTTSRLIGRHGEAGTADSKVACSCLESFGPENSSLLVSAGWSNKLYLWDIRTAAPVSETELPGKALALDVDWNHQRVVVATSGRRNCFFDVRKGKAELVLERESSLKFQTRCVKFFPDGKGIALGSVEGRAGIEFLDELGVESPMKRYAFKCHRVNDTGKIFESMTNFLMQVLLF
jgi:WD40 repeat protein